MDALEALRSSRLFAGLPDESLERIAAVAKPFEAPAGQVLIEPRMKGSGMFVIEEGTAAVELPGGEVVERGPGDVVGEMALLLPDETRTARVRAKTAIRSLTIDRQDFRDVLMAEPELAVAVMELVAMRLDELGAARSR